MNNILVDTVSIVSVVFLVLHYMFTVNIRVTPTATGGAALIITHRLSGTF